MQKHPFFDLQLVENTEISSILSVPVASRTTLQQWPLSCVEKITTSDSREWVLKSNHQPCDIEGFLYSQINHPNMVKPNYINSQSPYQSIIYPFHAGIPLKESVIVDLDDVDCLYQQYHHVLEDMIAPDIPVYLQIDTQETFTNAILYLDNSLISLLQTHAFSKVTIEHQRLLNKILLSPITQNIGLSETSLVHGDFSADNILLQGGKKEFTILDWQRPLYASPFIDQYTFYKSLNCQPPAEAVLMGTFLQIYWLVDCSVRWFPAGIDSYDGQILQLIEELISAFQEINTNQIKI